jgi:hypothetical protein
MDVRTLITALAACAIAACADATAPAALLGGRWTDTRAEIGSGYQREEFLTFRSDGILEHRMRIYRDGRLEDTFDFTYTYLVRDDSLFTAPAGITTANWVGTRFNRGKIDISASRLTITYPWFGPADESITVTQVFVRLPCRSLFPVSSLGCVP